MRNKLIALTAGKLPELHCHTLIIGSGIAGLSAALTCAQNGRNVILAVKEKPAETATYYAQGGIAAALMIGDSPEKHTADTLTAGQGLCDKNAVEILTRDGQTAVENLIAQGMIFDQHEGKLHFTMEGAHSHRRILHGHGDNTGRLLEEFLLAKIKQQKNITLYAHHFAIDLLIADAQCFGAVLLDAAYGRNLSVRADATMLATGGGGQVFRETTNPAISTGDGYALAYRAGAILRDMEMVQFHPTTLYLAGAPRFLISESVRGEGAKLINQRGERFMEKYDARGDLAPRDVVSRAIRKELIAHENAQVFLDLRHLDKNLIRERFPNISQICASYGLDITTDAIPVRPAAHYFMGGVKVDLDGKTTIERLLCVGETASTGVHGANRLASNSLLEGLVFGQRAGLSATQYSPSRWQEVILQREENERVAPLDLHDMLLSLKSLTWRNLGIFRSEDLLRTATQMIAQWERYVLTEQFQARAGFELQNMLTVAKMITQSALLRQESRGAHQRVDFPQEKNPATHTEISCANS